jgi:hypothetical protein
MHHNLNSQGIHYSPYYIFLHLSMGTTSQWQKFPKLGQFSFTKVWEFTSPKKIINTKCKFTILHILLAVFKGFVNIQSNLVWPFQWTWMVKNVFGNLCLNSSKKYNSPFLKVVLGTNFELLESPNFHMLHPHFGSTKWVEVRSLWECFALTLKHVHLHMHEWLMFAMSWGLPSTCLLIWILNPKLQKFKCLVQKLKCSCKRKP